MNAPLNHTRLLLVRHGEIDANVDGIWHGSTDSGLNERGRAQARAVARHLADARPGLAALYTSPLERTRHTAAEIETALSLQARPDPDLVEFSIGELEGVSYMDLLREHRFFERIFGDLDYAPPGGESVRGVIARMRRAFERIAAEHPGEEVAVVGHGAALGLTLADLLLGRPHAWRDYHVLNASVSELHLGPEPELVALSDVAHLSDLVQER